MKPSDSARHTETDKKQAKKNLKKSQIIAEKIISLHKFIKSLNHRKNDTQRKVLQRINK